MNLNEGLNRRSFLKGAALMGGAAAFAGMAGCAPQTSASQELSSTSDSAWDKEVDVVIAGAGGGGLAAAVEASAAGKEVVVCEVMSSATMSNSALCAGMIQGACTKLQKEAGIDDSVEEFDKYLTAVAEGFENPELRRLYAEKSGETIDSLAALRLARECGSTVISVVNVKGSTIARESDYVIYTHGGPEIAVASTKAYTVQIAALYLLFCRMALVRGVYTEEHAEQFMSDLLNCASAMETMIRDENTINEIVTHIVNYPDVFFIGRGMDYAFSLEGALKLKEISYIHAEAYAAGELKHGTIALITDHVPVIAIATQKHIFAKTISNIREVKARGAYVVLLVTEDTAVDEGIADVIIRIPKEDDKFTVFPIAVVLQLIAYYASVQKGLDVDQPRNLAKSVTVE